MKKIIPYMVVAMLCLNFEAGAQEKLKGRVVDAQSQEPLAGAIIKIAKPAQTVITNNQGYFELNLPKGSYELQIQYLGYGAKEIKIITPIKENLKIELTAINSSLNEVQVIGYGAVTKKLNTGSASTIKAAQIGQQPVTNLVSALSGRMPGVFVQTTNGLPGGNINVQIRGKGSITAGTAPLYVIDGVPIETSTYGANSALAASSIIGVINPLNNINPADIANISVLKDADATAIYGSRGSNGVILITTKKPLIKETAISADLNTGFSNITSLPALLDLQTVQQIRKEAFANDKLTPTLSNAPDLLLWDTNTTNWADYLFGGTARFSDAQIKLNHSGELTSFSIGGNLHQEDNIISSKANYTRGGVNFRLNHRSVNQKMTVQLSTMLTVDHNSSPNLQNATNGLYLSPNFPLLDNEGRYTNRLGNPLYDLNASLLSKANSFLANLSLGYQLLENVNIGVNTGYQQLSLNQLQLYPTRAIRTGANYSQFGNSNSQSFLLEPQVNYTKKIGLGKLSALLGGTYQHKENTSLFLKASNYSNEGLMESFAAAGTVDSRINSDLSYKFASFFARINYGFRNRYIVNLSFRRDGSSRFGPGHRFGNFGAIGAAWLFKEEKWLIESLPFLSFGKLRASYGTTGNDQITDYQYLSTYASASTTYLGLATLAPSRISNADFRWETTHKLEMALELGLFKQRVMFNLNYFRNRSKDQLVNYSLPYITGFSSYQANLPAVIQNKGWEFELSTVNIAGKHFNWSTNFNLTLPDNKLLSFERFETSSYAQTYLLGYDISRVRGYQFLGVDANTGTALYADENGKPSNNPYYNYTIGKTSPDAYGGFGNTFSYKGVSLDVFFQFTKQMSFGALRNSPGLLGNNFKIMENRWQKPGDITTIPKPSTIIDNNYPISSASYFDASYVRLKNIALSYSFSNSFCRKIGASKLSANLRAQNILTFKKGNTPLMDPETGGFAPATVAPLRTFSFGFNVTF